jgi:regulator of cell morphogenesis and NO signaling
MTVERLTAAEIAGISLAAVRVLEEHGIDYCAEADKPLQEICRNRNLDLAAIQEALSNATVCESDDADWTSAPLRRLMHHLAIEDHSWLRMELAALDRRLNLVMEEHGDAHPQLSRVLTVFRNLRADLETHMKHEEEDVFPAIERNIAAEEAGEPLRGSPLSAFGGPLRVMELEHETTGTSLRLLREFAYNYTTPRGACPRYKAAMDGIFQLEDRLLRHMYLENNVLFPRCVALKAGEARTLKSNSR